MKPRIAKIIFGAAGIAVTAFSLMGVANAQSPDSIRSQTQVVVTRGDHGRPDLSKVASGELTQAEADAKLAEITSRVTEMVNNGHPAGVMGFGGRGCHGSHGNEQRSNA